MRRVATYTDVTVIKFLSLFVCVSLAAAAQSAPPLTEKCRDILQGALADKNPDTRKQAVVALSLAASGDPFFDWLNAALQDRDVEVRLAAVASLGDLKSKRGIAALHKALQDPVPEVSFAAAKALWMVNDPAGKQALLSVLEGETKTSSSFFTKQKRDTLRLLHTPRPMFFFALKQGVGFVPVPGLGTGVSSMESLLSDPGVSGRAAAALLVAKDKDMATVEALRDALSDKDWSVRAAAVHALSLRNDPSLRRDLAPLLEDKKEPVRLRAAAGYTRLETIADKRKPRVKTEAN